MLDFLKRLIPVSHRLRRVAVVPGEIIQEKWAADFSKPKQHRFDIKSETLYDANLRKFGPHHCLGLGLKKTNTIAWVEMLDRRYGDLVLQGRVHIDSRGGYAAGGILFRMLDEESYYSFLVSSKGYFRLDVVRNGMPLPLVGWTELPDSESYGVPTDHGVDFSVIALGTHIVLLINGSWVAEISDATIENGSIAFVGASYEESAGSKENVDNETLNGISGFVKSGNDSALLLTAWPLSAGSPYKAEAFLESLSIESHFTEVSAAYDKWKDDGRAVPINPQCRLNLAETFTAMGQYRAAMGQIQKAWETPAYVKSQKELLLAGRLAQVLGLNTEAESYISACFQKNVDSPEGKEAITEMAKILNAGERFAESRNYCIEAVKLKPGDPLLYAFLGHSHLNLKENSDAALAYDKAYELDSKNGILAKNAATVYEIMGEKKEALDRFLKAARSFLAADNYNDLGLLVPKLLLFGEANPEAHGLAGKWAFGVEDWKMAGEEFVKARALEKKKRLPKDAALVYLSALLLVREGKRMEAIPLFEEAVSLNRDYVLFRFKLAENRYLLGNDPDDPKLKSDLEAALALDPKDGWINNFAAQLSLKRGNLMAAAEYLKKAYTALGDHPAIRVNRALLLARQGSVEDALMLLNNDEESDEEGVYANCAANILVEAERFEEADNFYRKALLAAPDNAGYLINRASCLIEMYHYGEADMLLSRAHSIAPGPSVLEMISYIAAKKGEYVRAESACREALEMDPNHVPSLLSLGWVKYKLGRSLELKEVLDRLKKYDLSETAIQRRDELKDRLDELLYQTISCASCERSWKVLRDTPPTPGKRLFAMPPDDMPAGSCASCGKTWCIGCAKKKLDSQGRFICLNCGKPLRFINEGLKKTIYDWAVADGLTKTKKKPRTVSAKTGAAKGKRGRPPKAKPELPVSSPETPPARKRGRPRKDG